MVVRRAVLNSRRGLFAFCIGSALMLGSCARQADTPEAHLVRGTEAIAAFDWDKAYVEFADARKGAEPKSELWLKATFGLANAAQHRMPASRATIEEARGLYEAVLAVEQNTPMAARSMLNLGRIAELADFFGDAVDLEAARKSYRGVIEQFAGTAFASEGTMRLAGSYISTFDRAETLKGIEILETWLREHPDEPMASAMYQYLGDTYFYPLGDYPKALAAYKQCDRLGWTQKGRQGGTYWRMAVMAERLSPPDRETAVTFYTKIIKETPTSGKAYESQLALKRLGAPVPPIELFPGAANMTASGEVRP